MNRPFFVAVLLASVVLSPARAMADDERLENAATVLSEMTIASDIGISPTFFAKAKCVVVVPSVKKAALGIGGQYGRGYISCRNAGGGWSAPGGVRIEGGSIGFQIGGSGTDMILLVMNDKGAEKLLSSKFTVGADAGVAAGPVGRQAAAQTDATLSAEIYAWSRSRGAYAGISLQGSTLRDDSSENKELYGREITNKEIVQGAVAAPKGAATFLAMLAKMK